MTTEDRTRDGFADFVRAETAGLTRFAYLLTGDRHHAEDLVQVALARVAVRWERLDDPAAYLRRVLYTQAASWWRWRRARPPERLGGAPPERAGPGDDTDLRLVLRAALARLTTAHRRPARRSHRCAPVRSSSCSVGARRTRRWPWSVCPAPRRWTGRRTTTSPGGRITSRARTGWNSWCCAGAHRRRRCSSAPRRASPS
ncbi:hypothetical protein KBX63_22340 [Micromonospora sp. U21]|nr:hypothetical protein [Micromonospora sp. U21]